MYSVLVLVYRVTTCNVRRLHSSHLWITFPPCNLHDLVLGFACIVLAREERLMILG